MALTDKMITIVGCGPGGEGWLADAARQAIAAADLIVGAPALLDRFAPAGVERIAIGRNVADALDRIAEQSKERRTVVLVKGDPGICSFAKLVISRFGRECCRVMSGISSVQAAFAALALDWTDARIVDGHGQPPRISPSELRNARLVAVLTGHPQTGQWLSQLAALAGCSWRIYSCRDLTLPTERVEAITSDSVAEAAAQPNTVIVFERVTEAASRQGGCDAEIFGASAGCERSEKGSVGRFYGVGTGPGDPGWLTVRAVQILAGCPHIFAPRSSIKTESLALKIAQPYIWSGAKIHELLFPMTKDEDKLPEYWRSAAEQVAAVLERGEDACFLTLGDPMLYSTYGYLVMALRERMPELKVETIPGIPSFCAAAALTGFTLGEGKMPMTVMPTANDLNAVRSALRNEGTVVLMKIGSSLPQVVKVLREEGCLEEAVLVSRAGQPGERIVTDLKSLSVKESDIGYMAVILTKGNKPRMATASVVVPTMSHLSAPHRKANSQPVVHFVGAGPGDPDLLTVRAARLLAGCRCCIYAGSLVSPAVLGLVPDKAEKHDSASMTLEQIIAVCREARERGVDVVRLHSGDPSIYGAIREQMAELDKIGIPYDVVPGISSFQAAAAELKTELTAPEVAQTVILTRTSGRTLLPREQELDSLAESHATICIFLSIQRIDDVAATLSRHYGGDCPAAVVYRASWPDQQILRGTLSDIAGQVAKAGIRNTAVIIVGRALGPIESASRLYNAAFSHNYRRGTE